MIKKGTYVYVTTEPFMASDNERQVEAICQATQDLDIEALRAEYTGAHRKRISARGFFHWLVVNKQVLEELTSEELFLGGSRYLASSDDMEEAA